MLDTSRNWFRNAALVMALLGTELSACSGGSGGLLASEPKPGPMPANAKWQGVYQGPYFIQLRIVTRGPEASGTWTAVGNREGEFSGTISGNLLLLDWSEHGLGNADAWSGRGYFVYNVSVNRSRTVQEIFGEWGTGKSGTTSSWWAIKRPSLTLNSTTARELDNDPTNDDAESCGVDCDVQDTDPE